MAPPKEEVPVPMGREGGKKKGTLSLKKRKRPGGGRRQKIKVNAMPSGRVKGAGTLSIGVKKQRGGLYRQGEHEGRNAPLGKKNYR